METCKLNNVDLQRYFEGALSRLVNGRPDSRIDELLPGH
ncbi:transposase domain-containing protein [Dankookia rubra]|uniref:Transposase domain-containing protein n=1 Tax=Dankookia rubra TaxID=1442381 RepID=A0A4R5QAG3_9PROT|nr:transposase domain-containing protein [Dankookia rubra]TDH59217.1 transposase domain-containing protein [Dankookia rubra]